MTSSVDLLKSQYESLKNKGNEWFKSKNYHKALSCYSEAIVIKPDEPVAYSNRAICYINLKRYFEAKDDCDKAIELNPNLTKAYYRRAIALRELSRYQKAMEDFETVFEQDPSFNLAKKEIESIKELIKNDTRLEIRPCQKLSPNYESCSELRTFELKNQYTGIKHYDQLA